MFSIVGIVLVFVSIVGGFLMEKGKILVLMQPAEAVIIVGAAVGTVLTASPVPTLMRLLKGMLGVFSGSPYTKDRYTEGLRMLYDLFSLARKSGAAKLEEDVDNPAKSDVFKKYPKFVQSHHPMQFLCDSLRTVASGTMEPMDVDAMMEADLDVHGREGHEPIGALASMADSLPGLGIVAAVLGVVITMGSLGGPKEEIGGRVAAALVGTFLGILLCYGVFGPIASAMTKIEDAEGNYFNFLRMGVLGYARALSPMMATELARRSIPTSVRPSFKEMEAAVRGKPLAGKPGPPGAKTAAPDAKGAKPAAPPDAKGAKPATPDSKPAAA